MQVDDTRLKGLLQLAKSFLGFVSVGAVNTVLSILLYEILILFLPYWLAYLIPFPFSIAFLLYANANFVFGRSVTLLSAVAFTLFYVASYAAGFLVIAVMVGLIGIPPAFAPVGVLAIMTPINFIGSRLALGR
jgi:putative flippase GtrA